MCGRQDSITLWSTRRKRRVATVHRTVAFTWVRARCYFRCGRQDSTILRCEFRRAGIQQQSTGLLHLHGFEPVARIPKKRAPSGALFFGAGDRTRTCTAKPEEPKSTESTNSTTPAYCLQPGYFIMGTRECQWTAAGTLEISRRKRAVFTIFVIFVLDIPARCL